MAIRMKTVEYAFAPLTGSYTEGTTYTDSPDLTVFIPETASRTFTSVQLDVHLHDNHAAPAADLSALSLRASCNAGTTWTTQTRTETLADTGENMSWHAVADVTAEFTARFGSATSGTCRFGFYADYSATGPVVTNVSAKLVITYTYDDVAETTDKRLKTVRIPLDGSLDRLTTTLANIGNANQIPALDTFLPEAGKVYRDIFFEFWTNFSPAATTDTALGFRLGTEAEQTTALIEAASQSPFSLVYRWKRTDMPTNAAQTLQARGTLAAAGAPFAALLCVTYEFDEGDTRAGSNRMLVSTEIALDLSTVFGGFTGERVLAEINRFSIPEANPTLVQSGVLLGAATGTTSSTINIANGTSANTAFTTRGQASQAGFVFCSHRVDGGATARVTTNGWTAVRGANTWMLNIFTGNVLVVPVFVRAYVNYTCDMPTALQGGHDAATHTVQRLLQGFNAQAGATNATEYTGAALWPNDAQFSQARGYFMHTNVSGASQGSALQVEVLAAETGAGVDTTETLGIDVFGLASERQPAYVGYRSPPLFQRYTNDPQRPLSVSTSRIYKFQGLLSAAHRWLVERLTYHAQSWTVTGQLTDYTGDGSGLTVDVFSTDTKTLWATTTTTIGGQYTVTLYQPGTTYYAVVRQSDALVGRSGNFTVP